MTAHDVVEPSRHEVFSKKAAKHGSFPIRASERSAHIIDGLACGEAYDVFFVTEVQIANKDHTFAGRGGPILCSMVRWL